MVRSLPWRSLANLALQLAILALLIAAFFMRMPQVSGLSMAPHIASGEYVLINTFAYRFAPPQRGDIVAFRGDDDAARSSSSASSAFPATASASTAAVVSIDGRRLDEPYVRFADDRSFAEIVVPPATRLRARRQSRRQRGFAVLRTGRRRPPDRPRARRHLAAADLGTL